MVHCPRSSGQPNNGPSSSPSWTGPVGSMHMLQPHNVLQASASHAPNLSFTFNTPTSSSLQDSETIIEPFVTARADREIYYHQLLTQKRGSPLWIPGPGMQLPVEYRVQGISIGDVGIITSTGTFDFLFNIFLPASDPINNGNVPHAFSPLPQVVHEIQKTCDFPPNSYIANSSVRKVADTVRKTRKRWFSSTSSIQHTFECSSGEAAILTMPDGASTQNLLATMQIQQCISENAQIWYEYARNERGRAISNGDICVVIGTDKVKSWGIATSTCNAGQTASLTFKRDTWRNRTRYCWDCTGGSGKVGPSETEIRDLIQSNPENQCVFVRTMNFTVSGEIWNDLSQATECPGLLTGQGDSVSANGGKPEGRNASGEAGPSSSPKTSSMQGTSRPIMSVKFDPMRHGIDYHPSARLHTHLHEKFPNASMVITQDSDWMSVLDDDDKIFPGPGELVERVLKSFNPTERDGIVTVRMKSDFQRKVTRDSLRSVSSHGDGTKMALPPLGETGQLLDAQTFAEISVFQNLDLVNPMAFSLDGKKDAPASDDEIMRLWDVQPLKNEKIENWLGEERKVWDRRQKGTKILLLGQSESGKSSILKHFQLAFLPKQFDEERLAWKIIVHLNIIGTLKTIIDALEEGWDSQNVPDDSEVALRTFRRLRLDLSPLFLIEANLLKLLAPGRRSFFIRTGHDWKTTLYSKSTLSKGSKVFSPEFDTTPVLIAQREDIISLWRNPKIQRILAKRRPSLRCSSGFFMDDIERVTSPDFLPTNVDIIRTRLKTIGIEEQHFKLQNSKGQPRDFYIIDVAGARSQRHSWVPFFDDVQCILFLAPLAFNETLEEDGKLNKVEDSFQLWEAICKNKLLANIHIILFLNKKDVLEATLASGIKVNKFIPSYGDRPNNIQSVTNYFKVAFRQFHKKHSSPQRAFICYETSAVDIASMQALLSCVRDTVLRKALATAELI